MTTFSIIIVTYNSSKLITPCLDSLYHTEGIVLPFEVIVVDNASSDGTVEMIGKKFQQVRIIENKENKGYGAAVNHGAEIAEGKFLIILNPDTIVSENFLQSLSEFFQTTPDAAIVGCRLIGADGVQHASCWHDPRLWTVLCEMFLPYSVGLPLVTEKPTTTKTVDMVSGACLAIKRNIFQQLNGFDEQFYMYYEDSDLCLRARNMGLKVFFHPAISVMHQWGGSTNDMVLFFSRVYRSKLLFIRKHRSAWQYPVAYLLIVFGFCLRIIAYFIVGGLSFNKKLLRLAKYYTLTLKKLLIG